MRVLPLSVTATPPGEDRLDAMLTVGLMGAYALAALWIGPGAVVLLAGASLVLGAPPWVRMAPADVPLVALTAAVAVSTSAIAVLNYTTYLWPSSPTPHAVNMQLGLRLQAALIGGPVIVSAAVIAVRALRLGELRRPRFLFEWMLGGFVLVAASSLIVGLWQRNPIWYVLGDSYRWLVTPAAYVVLHRHLDERRFWLCFLTLISIEVVTDLAWGVLRLSREVYRIAPPYLLPVAVALIGMACGSPRRPWTRALGVASYLFVALFVALTSLARAHWVALGAVAVLAVLATRTRALASLARPSLLFLVVAALTVAAPAGRERLERASRQAWTRAARTDVAVPWASLSATPQRPGVAPRGPVITESLQIRVFEAANALRELASSCGPGAYVLGCGAGAFFRDPALRITRGHFEGGGRQHNVHITLVNVLFRTGALGLAVFTGFVAGLVWVLYGMDRGASATKDRQSDFALRVYRVLLPASIMLSFSRFDFVGELSWAIQFAWLGWLMRRVRGTAACAGS
jgi:hypothetical protein